jgi:hypothetical protein
MEHGKFSCNFDLFNAINCTTNWNGWVLTYASCLSGFVNFDKLNNRKPAVVTQWHIQDYENPFCNFILPVAMAGFKPLTSGRWGECSTTLPPPLARLIFVCKGDWNREKVSWSLLTLQRSTNKSLDNGSLKVHSHLRKFSSKTSPILHRDYPTPNRLGHLGWHDTNRNQSYLFSFAQGGQAK